MTTGLGIQTDWTFAIALKMYWVWSVCRIFFRLCRS